MQTANDLKVEIQEIMEQLLAEMDKRDTFYFRPGLVDNLESLRASKMAELERLGSTFEMNEKDTTGRLKLAKKRRKAAAQNMLQSFERRPHSLRMTPAEIRRQRQEALDKMNGGW